MKLNLLPLYMKENSSFPANKETVLRLSHSLVHHWEIDRNNPVLLNLGSTAVPVLVEPVHEDKQAIFFCDSLLQSLAVPNQDLTLLSHFNKQSQTLTLGPVIAILTDAPAHDFAEDGPSFRSIHQFCEEFQQELSRLGGILYVCSLYDWKEGYVEGYSYQQDSWKKTALPYPNVVYNRIHIRKAEASTQFNDLKKDLQKRNIPIFNAQFFSKYDTSLILNKLPALKKYIPETNLLSKEVLEAMLNLFSTLYVKPIHGSQGRQIIQIRREEHAWKTSVSSGKEKGKIRFFSSFNKLWRWLSQLTKKRAYICQEGINFQQYHNRSLDFRILCHKDIRHQWKITSIVARCAQPEAFVANLYQGAEMISSKSVLQALVGEASAKQVEQQFKEISLQTAEALSSQMTGDLGELGIDMGIDIHGGLWIIEVNSKPSKNLDSATNKGRPSTKALLEYCLSLSFPHIKKGEQQDV